MCSSSLRYVFSSALCHSFVRLPFASQSLSLPNCCLLLLSATLTHIHTLACIWLYMLFRFPFSHSLRLMLLLVRCIRLRSRRCRLRCHSCQLLLFLPASFHTSSLLLLLATSLCSLSCCFSASLPLCLFIRIYVCTFRGAFLVFSVFFSFLLHTHSPTLVCHFVCLYIEMHYCLRECVYACVYMENVKEAGGKKTHYYALSGCERSARCRCLCCCLCRCRCLCTRR